MGRLRAVAYAGGVSVAVFAYLALPLLRELYGPLVDLPVFAAIALLAGMVTYGAARRIQTYFEEREARSPGENEVLVQGEVYRIGPDGDEDDGDEGERSDRPPDVDVETEMEQLRDDA